MIRLPVGAGQGGRDFVLDLLERIRAGLEQLGTRRFRLYVTIEAVRDRRGGKAAKVIDLGPRLSDRGSASRGETSGAKKSKRAKSRT